MQKIIIAVLATLVLQSGNIFSANQIIKKSVNNICHSPNGAYYKRTKKYTSFPSMAACIASGGRASQR